MAVVLLSLTNIAGCAWLWYRYVSTQHKGWLVALACLVIGSIAANTALQGYERSGAKACYVEWDGRSNPVVCD
jgi:hypothetical protein